MTLLKNLQESFDIRLDQAEEIISDLKDTYLKRSEKKKRNKKIWQKPKDLWETIERNNLCIIGVTEEKERRKGEET